MPWIRLLTCFRATWAGTLLLCGVMSFGQTAPSEAVPTQPAVTSPSPPPAPPLILIDPAHGGTDSGAILSPTLLEKDVTLAFAQRLRQELNTRGISAALVRESDVALPTDQRAAMSGVHGFALYISVHATSQGSGLRVYTAMLPASEDSRSPFISWNSAQAAALPRSRWIQQQIAAAIQKTGFPSRSLIAPLRPLNSVTVPAFAIEIGSTTGDVSQLGSSGYQAMICGALANALAPLAPQLRGRNAGP